MPELKQPARPANVPPNYVWNAHFGVGWWDARLYSALEAAQIFFNNAPVYWALGGSQNVRKQEWFWYIVEVLWGLSSKSTKKFVKHPWAEEMADACCEEKLVGLSGCASSGKSDFLAVWGIVNWSCSPLETKVFITSTSLKEARGRVWGSMRDYWLGCAFDLPGKLVDSQGLIRPQAPGKQKLSERAGIELIAGEQSAEKEAIGKLIGFKQQRVLLLADELSELSPAILEAAMTNLNPGNPDTEKKIPGKPSYVIPGFQMVAASNFKGFIDPFGQFVEPAGSWREITVETTRWRTKLGGVALRFDGLKSPNFDAPVDKWPIYGRKHLAEHEKIGRNTSGFWRMCRSFPAPMGVEDVIYTQNDLMAGGCFDKVVWSERQLVRIAALDPSFTSGGDRCIMHVGVLGYTTDQIRVLALEETIQLKEDVTDPRPFDRQILDRFREECEKRGILREQAAFDATGAGISFGTLIQEVWGDGLYAVKFGGSASELPVESGDTLKPSTEVYANRVTELWFAGKAYIRSGQIRGISQELADEMCSRHYDWQKGKETRTVVESKADMKSRGLRSPDVADAYFILLDLARVRFDFVPVGMEGSAKRDSREENPARKYTVVYDDEVGSWEEGDEE